MWTDTITIRKGLVTTIKAYPEELRVVISHPTIPITVEASIKEPVVNESSQEGYVLGQCNVSVTSNVLDKLPLGAELDIRAIIEYSCNSLAGLVTATISSDDARQLFSAPMVIFPD